MIKYFCDVCWEELERKEGIQVQFTWNFVDKFTCKKCYGKYELNKNLANEMIMEIMDKANKEIKKIEKDIFK